MRRLAKQVIFSAFRSMGAYAYLRRRHRHEAVVLTYHGILPRIPRGNDAYQYRNVVTTTEFERQIQFLLRTYRPLTAEDFYIPGRSISRGFLITFDDGFRNNLLYAMPILKKYGLNGCFFVTTGLIGTRNFLWTEQVTRLLFRTQKPELQLPVNGMTTLPLQTPRDRERASIHLRTVMKQLTPTQTRELLEKMQVQLGDVMPEMQPEEEDRFLFMNWEEVRQMIQNGQTIGSHTHTHPVLSTLTESESQAELKVSKTLIEQEVSKPCYVFSYPNGTARDFTSVQKQQLRSLGYRCAFTQIPLFNNGTVDPMELRRVNISGGIPMPLFEAMLCGFFKKT